MNQKQRLRFEEYMSACARACLVAEELATVDMDEFDWVWDTLSELLERYNDAGKPAAEAAGRRPK